MRDGCNPTKLTDDESSARLDLHRDTGSTSPDVRPTAGALHSEDDIDELLPFAGGPMPIWASWLTPFTSVLVFVLGKTIYRNMQLKKFASSPDKDATNV